MMPFRSLIAVGLLLLIHSSSRCDDYRIWSDTTGKHKIDAKFMGVEAEVVLLENKDGKKLRIPLSKLSEKDRGYIEAKAGDSPFEVVEEDSSGKMGTSKTDSGKVDPKKGNANKSDKGKVPPDKGSKDEGETQKSKPPKELDVDFQSVTAESVLVGDWSVKPDVFAGETATFKALDLPVSKIEREGITRVVTSTFAKRMAISYSPNDPWKKENNNSTRLVLIDLTNNSVLGNAMGQGRWEAMAIHDDGETIVVKNVTEGVPMGQLGTVKIKGKSLTAIDLWTPYASLQKEAKEKDVTFAQFANDGKLVTCSQAGNVVVWDFEKREPLTRFDYHGACAPSLSPNRKHIGFSGGDLVGFFDIDAGEVLGVKGAQFMNFWLKSAFSPSGKRFAAATMGKLMVWDVESGDVLFEGAFPGIPLNNGLQFPDENFLLISNDFLVELEHKIKLWQYVGTNYMTTYGSTAVFGVNHNNSLRFIPTKLPNPDALQLLKSALQQSDLFVVRKGVDMSIDVSQVPSQYQKEAEQFLQSQITKLGCRFSANAKVVLKGSVSGPKAEAVSYFFGGNFVLQQYVTTLEILYQGNPIWSGTATNTPGAISRGSKEEMQKEIDEAGKKPYVKYLADATLPEFIQKPTGTTANGMSRQTIGSSRVTPNGLQADK